MVQVIFTDSFVKELKKKFSKQEGNKILDLLETLKDNPYKGKELSAIGKIIIKEIKYNKFRFYFITDGYKIKFLKVSELNELIIKFIRISDKDTQQDTINDIKKVLRSLGEEGF
jgi:mRNA-degrading endonuclease RelE of RelBE toxin-antitoxin system